MNISEVKPALKFLGIFLGCYFLLSIAYGFWIESMGTRPDPMTGEVSAEVVKLLRVFGYDVRAEQNPLGPTIFIFQGSKKVLNVFEGCNGLNVMIVFLAFVLAFGGKARNLVWFVPLGLIIIHLTNLARILWLFWLAAWDDRMFYYFHKYLFTAVIYAIVFAMWWLWIRKWNGLNETHGG